MAQIQQHMGNAGLPQDFGTQTYEQQVVELEKRGEDAAAGGVPGGHGAGGGRVSPPLVPILLPAAERFCRKTRACALHLRKYNDALLINDAVRMVDAFQHLQQFYAMERDMKDPTERFLATTFEGIRRRAPGGVQQGGRGLVWGARSTPHTPFACAENRASLLALTGCQRYENPRLSKLEEILRENFQPQGSSRGIVFTKTRQSAHSLFSWLQDAAALSGQHIRAAVLTGAGYSNQTRHMTQVRGLGCAQTHRATALGWEPCCSPEDRKVLDGVQLILGVPQGA